MTIDYYNHNAQAYQQRTAARYISARYDAFLALLPAKAEILDAGCGPGRDSRAFIERGHRVSAVDASTAMVELASKEIGQAAILLPFERIEFAEKFDGVWANASLLHVASDQIDDVLRRLIRSLKVGGILFMSVKLGDGERISSDGRLFCDYTQASLSALLARHPSLRIIELDSSPAVAGQLEDKGWVHAIAQKIDRGQ